MSAPGDVVFVEHHVTAQASYPMWLHEIVLMGVIIPQDEVGRIPDVVQQRVIEREVDGLIVNALFQV